MSKPQHIQALENANKIRFAMADVKRDLKALDSAQSRRHAAKLLRRPTKAVKRMEVSTFIRSIRRMGPAWTHRLIYRTIPGVSPSRKVGCLSKRQRDRLADALLDNAEDLEAS